MSADEWITDVYKQEGGKWLCVLTHLTPVKKQVFYPHLNAQREEIITNYISGYNENNIEKMVRDFSGNIIFRNIYKGKITMEISGINAFRKQVASAISHYQQREQTITAIKHDKDKSEIDIDYVATLAFDLQNGLKKGEQIKLRGQSLFKFCGNQIVELTDIA